MKSFNVNKMLECSRNTLEPFGLWPKTNSDIWYNLKGIIGVIFSCTAVIITSIQGVKEFVSGDYENGSFSIFLTLTTGHITFSVLILYVQKPKFYKIINTLTDLSVTSHEDHLDIYVQQRLPLNKLIIQCQLVATLCASLTFGLGDLFVNYNDLPRYLAFDFFKKHYNIVTHVGTWVYFILLCAYCAYALGAYEGLIFSFISVGVIQLQMVQNQITCAINSYPIKYLNPEEVKYYDKSTNKLLKECVKRHNVIEKYIAAIENKFTFSCLVKFVLTLSATGFIGLTLILAPVVSANFVRSILMFFADMFQIVFLCVSGHELITRSETIQSACYMSNWYQCGPSVRKTLLIVMERCKKPFHLTLGKFAIISLQTFFVLLKTSMSYFSVLKNLYGEAK